MGRVSFAIDTPVASDRILAALLDFSERRPELWPAIDRKLYQVYSVSQESAEVREGSQNPFVNGGVWVREQYDWSTPGLVRATTIDSNVFGLGSIWQMRYSPLANGGTHVEVLYDRKAINGAGRVVGVLITLFGKPYMKTFFKKTLAMVQRQ